MYICFVTIKGLVFPRKFPKRIVIYYLYMLFFKIFRNSYFNATYLKGLWDGDLFK